METNIVVIFGGASSEHEVSRKSANAILSNINKEKYNIMTLGITKKGEWILTEASNEEILNGEWENHPNNRKAIISPDSNEKGLMAINKDDCVEHLHVDLVWPVLHGKNGEDGTIQGLCELAELKYVGPDVCSSAASMDKAVTKMIVAHSSVNQAKYLAYYQYEVNKKPELIIDEIDSYFKKYPLFVKPADAGSSVGISKVNSKVEISKALEIAFREDDRIVIEEGVVGQEVEVAVLGNSEPKASKVGEVLAAADWYDYDAKYKNTASRTLIPANIDKDVELELQKSAIEIYKLLGCKSLSRVDFFVTGDKTVIFNEINTLPGFTEISMYPKLWKATGVPYSELLDKIISYSME